jgi:hypothetical protein
VSGIFHVLNCNTYVWWEFSRDVSPPIDIGMNVAYLNLVEKHIIAVIKNTIDLAGLGLQDVQYMSSVEQIVF